MSSKETNKIRKNVKCNYFIKKYSIDKIESFTDMKLSDINDRLLDGLGIITRDDAKVLNTAIPLLKLLRKINFPSSLNKKFHDFLLVQQRQYRIKLQSLIDELEVGSKPVYYADLTNKKYASKLRNLDAYIDHDTIQAVFAERVNKILVKDKKGFPSYYSTLRDYKLRSKQLTGSRTNNMELMYDDIGFHKLSDDEIIDEAFSLTSELFSLPANEEKVDVWGPYYESDVDESPIIVREDGWSRIMDAREVPFETKYYVMTRHKDISNDKFRCNIEFIADIPSKTGTLSDYMEGQIKNDIKLIENFMTEKDKQKTLPLKKYPLTYGDTLINLYKGKWMKNFEIPVLGKCQ